ncbi:MAG: hypothetical protein ACI8ZM_001336 [Crocinitomix sp.]|jgi:hypothetical protein
MKSYPFIAIALTIFIQACGAETESNSGESEIQSPVALIDTTAIVEVEEPQIEINEHLQVILDKADTTYQLPMAVDTNFVYAIDFIEKSDRTALSFENGRYLSKGYLENAPTDNAIYQIETFCEIDSLKFEGAYDEYVQNLDIGMMQVSNSYVEGLIEIDSERKILLWSITFSTYEACPFASGSLVFGTLLNNYEVQNTMLVAECSEGSDPPSWGLTRISTNFSSASNIKTYSLNQSGDSDAGEVDGYEENYDTEIVEEGLFNAWE